MAPACVKQKMRQTTIRGIDDNRKVGTVKPSFNEMFMYTICVRINMAKLYWRIKKNGKWTWVATTKGNTVSGYGDPSDLEYKEEE